jgi:calcineurin-like phosphoesterase family protein
MDINENVMLYSDPHYGHDNIIKYCKRPFGDINQMNDGLYKRYCEVVSNDDLVIWLGDCWFDNKSKEGFETIKRLPGKRVLIPGNHDYDYKTHKLKIEQIFEAGFSAILPNQVLIKIANKTCKLSHFPYHNEDVMKYKHKMHNINYVIKDNSCDYLIHGHTHQKEKIIEQSICVCVEAWDYYPVRISEIKEIILENERNALTD